MIQSTNLTRIVRYLMLHSSFTHNLGLLNGKTGIAIFFFQYARHTGIKLYEKFAEDLVIEIYDEIHTNYSTSFYDGLCGIGWGIEYLIRNKFVEADADEVLEDFDRRILERDVRRIADGSLNTGLKGIACYIISRCANKINRNNSLNKEYIQDLIWSLNKEAFNNPDSLVLINQLENIMNEVYVMEPDYFFNKIIHETIYHEDELFSHQHSLGIANNGYAGIGLKILGGE